MTDHTKPDLAELERLPDGSLTQEEVRVLLDIVKAARRALDALVELAHEKGDAFLNDEEWAAIARGVGAPEGTQGWAHIEDAARAALSGGEHSEAEPPQVAWLAERTHDDHIEWWTGNAYGVGSWVRDANDAGKFSNREQAETYIAKFGLSAIAVEHSWMTAIPIDPVRRLRARNPP